MLRSTRYLCGPNTFGPNLEAEPPLLIGLASCQRCHASTSDVGCLGDFGGAYLALTFVTPHKSLLPEHWHPHVHVSYACQTLRDPMSLGQSVRKAFDCSDGVLSHWWTLSTLNTSRLLYQMWCSEGCNCVQLHGSVASHVRCMCTPFANAAQFLTGPSSG